MTYIPTITFETIDDIGNTLIIDARCVVSLRKNTNNITDIKFNWNDKRFSDWICSVKGSVKDWSDKLNYSFRYANEWNRSGVEPKHLGDTPFPTGVWEI